MTVKDLLSSPHEWEPGVYARDNHGNQLLADDDDACCWNLTGAIERCYPDVGDYFAVMEVVDLKVIENGFYDLTEWEEAEDRTFADVVALVTELNI